jgi:ribosomal-protein-alanine acetyltransferase
MVKHVIIWTLKDEYSADEKKKIAAEIKEGLEGLKGVVPGIVEIKVNTDGLASSNGDLMLDSVFENEDALKGYSVHPAHVAVADGKIAGYVGAESVLDESNIGNIVTHKEFRGKGIGTKLFRAMLDELKASGIVKVFLEVEHDNVPALRLYEKLKFVKYGHRRDYYGAGKDAVLMSLDLD